MQGVTPEPVATPPGPLTLGGRVRQMFAHWALLLRLLGYVRPYGPRFVLMLGLTVLASLTRVSGLVLVKPFGDIILGTFDVEAYTNVTGFQTGLGRRAVEQFAATLSHSPHAALVILVQLLLSFIVIQSFASFGATYLQINVGGRIAVDLQRTLVSRLLAQPVQYFRDRGKGIILQIIDQDAASAFRTLYVMFNRMARAPVEACAALAIALSVDWKLTVVAICILPVIGLIIFSFRRRLRRQEGDLVYYVSLGSIILQEMLAAPLVVKAYQMEEYFESKFRWALGKRFRVMMSLRKSKEWMGPLTDLTIGVAVVTFVYLNGRALIRGELELSSFLLLYVCLGSLVNPIRKAAKGYAELMLSFMALERVFHMLDSTPAIHDDSTAVPLEVTEGRVEYRNVTFGYDPGRPVFENVTLTLPAGQRTALVGPSGSGKTTLANLLLRFYEPQVGQILIDGVDIRTVTQESLRRTVGLVTQATVVFSGTVRENIAAGREDADGTLVEKAARSAQAHEFIMDLPQGYETRLGDMGTSLSGGQQQRLAIARALFRNTPILVLDEATSSLDAVTEDEIHAEFLRLTEGRTTVIIAHRFSTILDADHVVLVYEGRVAGAGTHAQLWEGNALYRELFERQLLPVTDDRTPENADGGTGRRMPVFTGERGV